MDQATRAEQVKERRPVSPGIPWSTQGMERAAKEPPTPGQLRTLLALGATETPETKIQAMLLIRKLKFDLERRRAAGQEARPHSSSSASSSS
jgi:hypothetical protein